MINYIVPVAVRAFRIGHIEGYRSFPIQPGDYPPKLPGDLRMVYSEDDNDMPVCVDSSFISSIKPGESGYYVEYPDGHAAYWDEDALKAAQNAQGGLSFAMAIAMMEAGKRVYRECWGEHGVYLVQGIKGGVKTINCVKPGQPIKEWYPLGCDVFANDWGVLEGSL